MVPRLTYLGPRAELAFLCTVVSSARTNNEFRPAIYVMPDFFIFEGVCRVSRAIMVLKDIDDRELRVWRPQGEDWQNLVSHYLCLPGSRNASVPTQYREADVAAHGDAFRYHFN